MPDVPSFRMTGRVWLALFALGVAVWLTIHYASIIANVLWVVFAAAMITMAVGPLATRLQRWHIPRGVTLIVVYILLIAVLAGLGYLVATLVMSDGTLWRRSFSPATPCSSNPTWWTM